ncbi:SDR family NAD(P)-dependent oxidoreductase, partial [Nocardia xishanensis]
TLAPQRYRHGADPIPREAEGDLIMNRYTNRTVLITGGAQGIGRAMADRFVTEGATVAVADLNTAALDDLVAAHGTRAFAAAVDVTDSRQVDDWITQTIAALGHIDVLVNNAGVLRDSRLEVMTDDQWRTVIDVHLGGMFHCSRAVFPHMIQRGYGRILSISSICRNGNFGQINYAAAKAGIVAMARTIALEGARHGITSNAIAPGVIHTPMLDSLPDSAQKRLTRRIPLNRVGAATDIAEAAAYLCSEAAGYVTGTVLGVDGGVSAGIRTA